MNRKSVHMGSFSNFLRIFFLVIVVPFLQNRSRQDHLYFDLPSRVNLPPVPENLAPD